MIIKTTGLDSRSSFHPKWQWKAGLEVALLVFLLKICNGCHTRVRKIWLILQLVLSLCHGILWNTSMVSMVLSCFQGLLHFGTLLKNSKKSAPRVWARSSASWIWAFAIFFLRACAWTPFGQGQSLDHSCWMFLMFGVSLPHPPIPLPCWRSKTCHISWKPVRRSVGVAGGHRSKPHPCEITSPFATSSLNTLLKQPKMLQMNPKRSKTKPS